jgi:LPXTG-site transpeptidase (sortase) family protein
MNSVLKNPTLSVFSLLLVLLVGVFALSGIGLQPASAADGLQPLAITLTPTPTEVTPDTPTPTQPTPTPTATPTQPTPTPTVPTPTPTLPSPTPTQPTPTPTQLTPTPTQPTPTPTQPTPTPTVLTPTPDTPTPTPTLPSTPQVPPVTPPPEVPDPEPPTLIPGTGEIPLYLPARFASVFGPDAYRGSASPTAGQQALAVSRIMLGGPDNSSIYQINIPKLGVFAPVRMALLAGETWDIRGLGKDVAWLEGTSLPGKGSNTVLAGHISVRGQGSGPFQQLYLLAAGDTVIVTTQQGIYTYAVQNQMVVAPTSVEVLSASETGQLTLVTCTGWDEEAQDYVARRVIQAVLVDFVPRYKNDLNSARIQ